MLFKIVTGHLCFIFYKLSIHSLSHLLIGSFNPLGLISAVLYKFWLGPVWSITSKRFIEKGSKSGYRDRKTRRKLTALDMKRCYYNEIQNISREHFENLYSKRLEHLEEIGKFVSYELPKSKSEERPLQAVRSKI